MLADTGRAKHGRRQSRASGLAGLLALAAGAAQAGAMPDAALERRVGYAFSLDTGEAVYREIHEPVVDDGALLRDEVTYRGPDDAVIARKRVDFRPDPLAPAFRLTDRRSGYVEGLERSGGQVTLFRRQGSDAAMERVAIDAPDELVADAGFDVLIYRRLEELAAGKTLAFPFAAAGRLAIYDYRLRKVDEATVLGEPAWVIRFEPNAAVLRWLVDPIEVAYQRETGALLRYEGVSNLPNPDADGHYRVRIEFPPAGREPQPPTPE